jgi:hypothetical protein
MITYLQNFWTWVCPRLQSSPQVVYISAEEMGTVNQFGFFKDSIDSHVLSMDMVTHGTQNPLSFRQNLKTATGNK